MSKSHINSNLNIQGTIVGVNNSIQSCYPFKYTANDTIYNIQPTINSNTTMTSDGIAVEEGTTNLIPDPNLASYAGNENWIPINDAGCIDGKGLKISNGTKSIYYLITIPVVAGEVYTLTTRHFISKDYNTSLRTSFCLETVGGLHHNLIGTKMGEWETVSLTFTIAQTGNLSCGAYNSEVFSAGYIIIDWMQLEKKSFATSFVNGSRSAGSLSLTSNAISETKDWTVACWILPRAGYSYAATSSRINFYAVGNYYTIGQADVQWSRGWGATPKNDIFLQGYVGQGSQYTSAHIVLSDTDANNWGLYIIRFNSTTKMIKGDIIGISGVRYNIPEFNHPLTNISQMIIVGGYGWDADNGNCTFKDLAIFNEYISDNYIESLYRSPLNFNSEEGVCT